MSFFRKNCPLIWKYAFSTYLVWKLPFSFEMLPLIIFKNIFIWQNKSLVHLYHSEAIFILLILLYLAKGHQGYMAQIIASLTLVSGHYPEGHFKMVCSVSWATSLLEAGLISISKRQEPCRTQGFMITQQPSPPSLVPWGTVASLQRILTHAHSRNNDWGI